MFGFFKKASEAIEKSDHDKRTEKIIEFVRLSEFHFVDLNIITEVGLSLGNSSLRCSWYSSDELRWLILDNVSIENNVDSLLIMKLVMDKLGDASGTKIDGLKL